MLIKNRKLAVRPAAALGQATRLRHLEVTFEQSTGILWKFIKADATPHFSHDLLDDIRFVQERIRNQTADALVRPIDYVVFASKRPSIFSLGGDLRLFRRLITEQNRDGLMAYATKAAAAVYDHAAGYPRTLSFSLVQGNAMGGGFEAALAGNVLVAERGTRLGFPEVLFGLFPGMGAYTLLRRKVDAATAEEIILGARNYPAEELHAMGIVDILCAPGTGEQAIRNYVAHQARRPGERAFRQAIRRCRNIDRDELFGIAAAWVDSAMDLSAESLRRIDRLIANQERSFAHTVLSSGYAELAHAS